MPDSNITKRALAQALKDLMRHQSFQKISVGEICEACGMNRKSFYYHFRDKHDLVCWIFQTEFFEHLHMTDGFTGWSLLSDACGYLYGERAFYRDILAIDGQNSLREYLKEQTHPLLVEFAHEMLEGFDAGELDFCLSFYTDSFLTSIVRWLSAPEVIQPEEYIEQIRRLLENTARLIRQIIPGDPALTGP